MNEPKPRVANVASLSPVTSEGPPTATGDARSGGIIAQLGRRKVCRTAISYMLVMWLNLQIGDVIFPLIGVPDWALTLVIVIGVMGFPVVLILAWAFQITSRGIVLDQGNARDEASSERATERALDTVVNLLLLLFSVVLSVLLLSQFLAGEPRAAAAPAGPMASDHVIIEQLKVEPLSDTSTNRMLAAGVEAELAHRLIALEGFEVRTEDGQPDPDATRQRLSVVGDVLLESDAAYVRARIADLGSETYLGSISVELEVDSLHGAEALAGERIVEAVQRAAFPDAESMLANAAGKPRS